MGGALTPRPVVRVDRGRAAVDPRRSGEDGRLMDPFRGADVHRISDITAKKKGLAAIG